MNFALNDQPLKVLEMHSINTYNLKCVVYVIANFVQKKREEKEEVPISGGPVVEICSKYKYEQYRKIANPSLSWSGFNN